jgi:glyceraldehyde 3-phosphate dehydrogenase
MASPQSTINIGINGFGRIGRQVFRASLASTESRVVAINDPFLDAEGAANAIRYDTAAGRFRGTVEVKGRNLLIVDGARVSFTSITDPSQIPWTENNVSFVLECSGVYTTAERAAVHLAGGAQRVIIASISADAPLLVLGANEETFKPSSQVVSAGSSTAVALAPVLKALNGAYGLASCTYTCIHAATNGKTTDSTNAKDPRAARAALGNIVPIALAADLKALQRALPRIAGRIAGSTVRVPVTVGALIDVVVTLNEASTLAAIAELFENARIPATHGGQVSPTTATPIKAPGDSASVAPKATDVISVLGATREPVVSGDFAGETRSAVLDVKASMPIVSDQANPSSPTNFSSGSAGDENAESKVFKLVLWLDNERGYAQRLLDIVSYTSASW